MTTLPVMAIASDRLWRARLERILTVRGDISWLGAYGPGEVQGEEQPALLLVDGDDPRVEREIRAWRVALPQRLYFYRSPTVAALHDCVRSGASGCLGKDASPEVVLRALRAVVAGLFAVEPVLMLRAVLTSWHQPSRLDGSAWSDEPMPACLAQLTQRQREIVEWAAQGLSNKQIARNLGISPETVKTHLHHAFERAGVSGRVALSAAQWSRQHPPARDPEETLDQGAGAGAAQPYGQ
ncbi:response regulator transcription factor [Aerolutibacter ruishenii]|uniref:DNA-binding NarL/FixJ family response regulator n=1 Tax=Aerolutibacter ruishenii TaxID=686800 RepID=A0A562LGX6_9GAMM|nr:response regulator transcription factor [Lysobacter ruishenii]TWI06846.1 DNA-binding NarL/FixJ family response regulator [Lysobacter ruishenii]